MDLAALAGSLAAWLGTASLTCGGILMGWAEVAARAELQTVGLPIAIAGALAIALGVMLQLDRDPDRPRAPAPSGKRRIDAPSTHAAQRPDSRRSLHHQPGRAA